MGSNTPEAVFLLHKKNQAYLDGQERYPAILIGPSWGFLLMGLVVAIGVGFLIWAYVGAQDYRTLRDDGQIIEGNVVDRRFTSGRGGSYYLTYTFVVQGVTYSREQLAGEGLYNQYASGGAIDILYDPGDPTLSKIEGTNNAPYTLVVIGLFWVLGGILAGAWVYYDTERNRLLAREGRLVYGEISKISGRRLLNRRESYQVTVHYELISPETGQQIRKKASDMRNDLSGQSLPQPGTPVAIMYRSDKHYKVL
jgi:hypothetical protein